MPLKLNIGLSRKVGEPNYCSRGAAVNIELELDSSLVTEPDRLQDRIRQMFRLAKESVDEQLSQTSQPANRNGGNQNNNGGQHKATRPATASQVRALHAIANRQKADLARLVQDRFQVSRPEDLSITQASQLIDELKKNSAV